jgi:hypothetical protein
MEGAYQGAEAPRKRSDAPPAVFLNTFEPLHLLAVVGSFLIRASHELD